MSEKSSLLEWLGASTSPDWSKAKPVGAFLGVLLFLLFILALGTAFLTLAATIRNGGTSTSFGVGALIVAILGAPFVVWRTSVAQQTLNFQRDGNITDRISKAVEQLGAEKVRKHREFRPQYLLDAETNSLRLDDDGAPMVVRDQSGEPVGEWHSIESTEPNLEVRIGAIASLERIAQDSIVYDNGRDHIRIMEILGAYVRNNSVATALTPREPPFDREIPRTDIQTVIDVLARRNERQREIEAQQRFRVNLANSDLSFIDFRGGDFSGTLFISCSLEAARFRKCALHGTNMSGSLLNFADFHSCKLVGTRLDFITINRPIIPSGGMCASLNFAEIDGITLIGADISQIDYLGDEQTLLKTFGTNDTILHPNLNREREDLGNLQRNYQVQLRRGTEVEAEEARSELDQTGFSYWSPYDSSDGSTGWHLDKFWVARDLKGWPYTE